MKKKKKPTREEVLLLENAALMGFVARLHGFLHLPIADEDYSKLDLCREWLSREVRREREKAPTVDSF